MNASWALFPLEELCDRITVGHVGPMANEYVTAGVPFLRSQNILPFRITSDNLKYIPRSFHEKLSKSALHPGDVVVVRTGYPGTAAVIPQWLGEANCADLVVITPGRGLDPSFLASVFNSSWGAASVAGRLVGAAQQHFNIGAARRLVVRIPPLSTQRKISAVLSAYDDLIENNNRRIKLLEEMAQRLYSDWFVDFRYPGHEEVSLVASELGPIPEKWAVRTLGEVCTRITDGAHHSPVTAATGYPMASVKDMTPRSLNIATCRLINDEDYEALVRQDCRPRMGDVLVSKDGANFLKHIFPLFEDSRAVLLSSVAVLRPSNLISPAVLSLTLRDPTNKAKLKGFVSGAAVPRVVLKDFKLHRLIVPASEIQERFDEIGGQMMRQAVALELTNRCLLSTRDLLLPRLISGEVDVSDLEIAAPEAAA